MDINVFHSWFTLVMLILFVLLIGWAWSSKRVKEFREAANLPFDEPETPRHATNNKGGAQ